MSGSRHPLLIASPPRIVTRLVRLALVLVAAAAPLRAQRVVPIVEVGGSRVRYGDSVSSSAFTVSPSIRGETDRTTVGAAGTLSQFAGGWSGQGAVNASLYLPLARLLTGELSGTAGGSAHSDESRTGQSLVLARAHLMSGARGAWAGAGLGTSWDGATWRAVRIGEVAAWTRTGGLTALASVTPTQVGDTIRYADSELAGRWELPRAELGASVGFRSGDRLPVIGGSSTTWGSASAVAWITPGAAVVVTGGSYPVDFTEGFPGGRFVSVALRFGPRASARFDSDGAARRRVPDVGDAGQPDALPAQAVTGEGGVLAFQATTDAAGRQGLRVHAPGAASVELMGDFTQWEPLRLVPAGGGWWAATVAIPRGTYEMNVRVDGGRWLVPPGLTAVRDEFGGSVGLLLVP